MKEEMQKKKESELEKNNSKNIEENSVNSKDDETNEGGNVDDKNDENSTDFVDRKHNLVICDAQSALTDDVKLLILSLELLLPSSVMNMNWSILRDLWLKQVNSCSNPKDLARVIIVLISCIKPMAYIPFWHEHGHVKIDHIIHAEQEEKKKTDKKDKEDKKDKDAKEEEQNKLSTDYIKYLDLNHKVHKQKGEEYRTRTHGLGWQWLSKTRNYKLVDSSKQGLAAGPAKRIFQGKDNKGIQTFSIAETLYTSIIMKKCKFDSETSSEIVDDQSVTHLNSISDIDFINKKIILPITKLDENVNVSNALAFKNRILYPKLPKKYKIDMLLPRRIQLKLTEERSLTIKNIKETIPKIENHILPSTPQVPVEIITKSAEKFYMLNTLQTRKTEQSFMKLAGKRGGAELKGVLVDCVDEGRIYSTDDTRKKIYLKKFPNKTTIKQKSDKTKFPQTSWFCTRNKLRTLARHAGSDTVNGFIPNAKTNNAIWPYTCPQPYFKTYWLYITMTNTILAVVIQLKILWTCLKLDELTAKTTHLASKPKVKTETDLVTTETLKCRTSNQSNEHTEYLKRKVVIPRQMREVTSIHSSLRKRKREESPKNTAPQVSKVWVDENKLKLIENKQFHESTLKMQQALETRSTNDYTNKLLNNDSSHNRIIIHKIRLQNSETTDNINEQLKQSLGNQRLAHKRSMINDHVHSSSKKICLDMPSTQSPATSNSTKRLKLVSGEGARLRLMPNNKLLVQNSTLSQSSPRVVAKPSTSLTRPIFITKYPHGKFKLVTTPKTIITDNVINQKSLKSQPTNTQLLTTNNVTQQKFQCIKGEDGKIRFKCLQPEQQSIQSPDEKLHVNNYSAPQNVQITKNKLLTNSNNVTKTGTQMEISGKKLDNVSQWQKIVVRHNNSNKATINERQVMIRLNTGNTSNLINNGGHTIKLVCPQQNVQKLNTSVPLTPQVITQPMTENAQDKFRIPTMTLVDEQEKLLLANQLPGTVIKCITAQVIQSPTHGRQILLKGIKSNDFTPQKLQFVKHQIKQKLLKAQESNSVPEVFGPIKIYLIIQPPDPRPCVPKIRLH